MTFQAGQSGNPRGRPKGSYGGRIKALNTLDKVMDGKKNLANLAADLQTEFDKDRLAFFRTYIMPLLPKEAKLAVVPDGIVEWKSLVETFPKPAAPAAPAGENKPCPPG